MHSILAAFIVYVNQHINSDFNLPSSIVSLIASKSTMASENLQIPSLSIVVGLMLVFRNQTAYSRFWGGRCHLNTVTTAVRCLSRQILVLVPAPTFSGLSSLMSSDSLLPTPKLSRESTNGDKSPNLGESVLSPADQAKTMETVKILIAMLYTIKNHLRAEWGVALSPGTSLTADGQEANTDEYKDLLPPGLKGYEHRGLGLTLELATFVEKYIQMGVKKYDDFPP
jgi:putative membrane protein